MNEGEVRNDLELYEETNHSNFCPLRFAAPNTNLLTSHSVAQQAGNTTAPTYWSNYHYPPSSSPEFTHTWDDKQTQQNLAKNSSFHPCILRSDKNPIAATLTTKATSNDVVVSSSRKHLPATHSNDLHNDYGPDLVMNQNYHLLVVQNQQQLLPSLHQKAHAQLDCKPDKTYDSFHVCPNSSNTNVNKGNNQILSSFH